MASAAVAVAKPDRSAAQGAALVVSSGLNAVEDALHARIRARGDFGRVQRGSNILLHRQNVLREIEDVGMSADSSFPVSASQTA